MVKPKILIANGVNLDLLGRRDPKLYGNVSLSDINVWIEGKVKDFAVLEFFQTNSEVEYLEKIWESDADALILNPGAWTHTSLALADRIECLSKPIVEVHLSHVQGRPETIRHVSMIARHCIGSISGFKEMGYVLAVEALVGHLQMKKV